MGFERPRLPLLNERRPLRLFVGATVRRLKFERLTREGVRRVAAGRRGVTVRRGVTLRVRFTR